MVVVESLSKQEIVDDVKCLYTYRLIKRGVFLSDSGESIEVQSYGIEVERQDMSNGRMIGIERDCVPSISPQRHKVHNMLKMLYEHTVSPLHLIDVLGETIDEYITDFDDVLKNTCTC